MAPVHVFVEIAKFPLTATLLTASRATPLFFNVTFLAALVSLRASCRNSAKFWRAWLPEDQK